MENSVKKANIQLSETIYKGKGQSVCQADVIVPDIMPDVLKVLQVEGKSVIENKVISEGKISVRGRVDCTIIYLPENMGRIKSIEYSVPFSFAEKTPDAMDNMMFTAENEVVHLEYQLVNSRKISIKAIVETRAEIMGNTNVEYVCTGEETNAQVREKHIDVSNVKLCEEKDVLLSETVSVPDKTESIIKTSATITKQEFKVINNKIVAKGELCVKILYCRTDGVFDCVKNDIPFTEIVEFTGINEKHEVLAYMKVKEVKWKIQNMAEGKCLAVDVTTSVSVCACEDAGFDVTCDIYGVTEKIVPEIRKVPLKKYYETKKVVKELREIISLEENQPGIEKIFDLSSNINVAECKVKRDETVVSCEIKCSVTYISDKEEEKIQTVKFSVPFEMMIENPGVVTDTDVKVKVKDYAITSGERGIEAVITVEGELRPFYMWDENIVTNVKYEEKSGEKRPAIVLYYVQSGDTMWEIAKKYQSKISAIEEINKISADSLVPGTMLLIPKN